MTANFALVAVATLCVACVGLAVLAVLLWRGRHAKDPHELLIADMAHKQHDMAVRLEAMIGVLANGQTQLQQAVNERLDSVTHRLGDSLQKTTQNTAEHLQKLHERLGVIDSAQQNITQLATQVTSLQSVLMNKQSRGAFGQGRMEAIVSDGLPKDCYAFQYTLSNKSRPDCVIFLPDKRPLVVDSKFPLEAVTAYSTAKTDDDRKQAAAKIRQDVSKHVGDIAYKYLVPGETQDLAFMFVPSESVYAELHENFDDLVQKAFRAKVVIISPSLLMLAIQLVRQNQRDVRMQEAADKIRDEVGRLIDDVARMHERVIKLQGHFGQANEDVRQIVISAEKVQKRGARITEVEFEQDGQAAEIIPASPVRKLEAGE